MKLGVGGGVQIGNGGSLRVGPSLGGPAATIAQNAYGQESSPSDAYTSGIQSWHLAVAVPIVAVGWLAFLRWSLPK
jgi:hypothetical protein